MGYFTIRCGYLQLIIIPLSQHDPSYPDPMPPSVHSPWSSLSPRSWSRRRGHGGATRCSSRRQGAGWLRGPALAARWQQASLALSSFSLPHPVGGYLLEQAGSLPAAARASGGLEPHYLSLFKKIVKRIPVLVLFRNAIFPYPYWCKIE